MLLVNARIGVSSIHGFGLIAQEFIPKGTCIWQFQPGFDLMIGEKELMKLSISAQRQVRHYAFFDAVRRAYVLSSDDDRFTNHSDSPNTQEEGGYESYANRDIQAGEEITWSYRGWEMPTGNNNDKNGNSNIFSNEDRRMGIQFD